MLKYIRVWYYLSIASFQVFFSSRIGSLLFLFGKIIRFLFFLGFLVFLTSKTNVLAGYNLWHILLFYITFNFIDATTQMIFREVYRFRQSVVSGDFDLVLVKPVNPLFRVLFGGMDLLDFITLVPFVCFIAYIIVHIPGITFFNVLLYILFIGNALFIATSFHIMVLALAVLTTEIDNAIMIYRDFTSMGKLPIDIYQEPLRFFITFVIPVGIMMTLPVKIMLGLVNLQTIFISFGISSFLFIVSILFWQHAMKYYTSASS